MTREEYMVSMVRRHMDAELEQDIDAVMATLVKEPYYEIHPTGISVRGQLAVREMYKKLLPGLMSAIVESKAMTFKTGDPKHLWVGPDGVVIREFCTVQLPDGKRVEVSEMAIFSFDGDLLIGEQFYCNAQLGELFDLTLGEEFRRLPGVQRLQQ